MKVNNIDLFANTQRSITEKNNSKNYSFNGKKLKTKIKEKGNEESPADNLYKIYFNKNIQNGNLSKEKTLNNLKRIKPIFGRTAYAFYDHKDNHDLGNIVYNNII